MGLRFRKSFKVAPGVKFNVNKKSVGVTIGGKGVHHTVNTSGRKTSSVGIPGTGLYYQSVSGGENNHKKTSSPGYDDNNFTISSSAANNTTYNVEDEKIVIGKKSFNPATLNNYYIILTALSIFIYIMASALMPVGIIFWAISAFCFNMGLSYKLSVNEYAELKQQSDNIVKAAVLNGNPVEVKKKKASWVIWILVIFFPPLAIIYLWRMKKDTSHNKKTLLTILLCIYTMFLVISLAGSSNSPATEQQTDSTVEETMESTTVADEQITTEAAKTNEQTELQTEATTQATTEAPVTEPATTAAPVVKEKSYVVNTSTNVFHKPTCGRAKRIKDSNRMEITSTYQQMINSYTPCKVCNPN